MQLRNVEDRLRKAVEELLSLPVRIKANVSDYVTDMATKAQDTFTRENLVNAVMPKFFGRGVNRLFDMLAERRQAKQTTGVDASNSNGIVPETPIQAEESDDDLELLEELIEALDEGFSETNDNLIRIQEQLHETLQGQPLLTDSTVSNVEINSPSERITNDTTTYQRNSEILTGEVGNVKLLGTFASQSESMDARGEESEARLIELNSIKIEESTNDIIGVEYEVLEVSEKNHESLVDLVEINTKMTKTLKNIEKNTKVDSLKAREDEIEARKQRLYQKMQEMGMGGKLGGKGQGGMGGIVDEVMDGLLNAAMGYAGIKAVGGKLGGKLLGGVKGAAGSIWKGVKGVAKGAGSGITQSAKGIMGSNLAKNAFGAVKGAGSGIVQGAKSAIGGVGSAAFNAVKSVGGASGVVGALKGAVARAPGPLKALGLIGGGIGAGTVAANGISSGVASVATNVPEIVAKPVPETMTPAPKPTVPARQVSNVTTNNATTASKGLATTTSNTTQSAMTKALTTNNAVTVAPSTSITNIKPTNVVPEIVSPTTTTTTTAQAANASKVAGAVAPAAKGGLWQSAKAFGSRILGTPLTLGIGAYEAYNVNKDTNLTTEEKTTEYSKIGGKTAGTLAGAKVGAVVGAVGGPIGAAIGGVIGGIGGYFLGEKGGEVVGDIINSVKPGSKEETIDAKVKEEVEGLGTNKVAGKIATSPNVSVTSIQSPNTENLQTLSNNPNITNVASVVNPDIGSIQAGQTKTNNLQALTQQIEQTNAEKQEMRANPTIVPVTINNQSSSSNQSSVADSSRSRTNVPVVRNQEGTIQRLLDLNYHPLMA